MEAGNGRSIRNVVLDIGGVLVDYNTRDYYTARGYAVSEAEKLKAATMDSTYWKEFDIGLMPYDWIVGKMKEGSPSLASDIGKCLEDQRGIVSYRKESKGWIETIRQKGVRVLVLSNFSYAALHDCPEALDFLGENLGGTGKEGEAGVICEGILSCHDHVIKPYPSIYALLLSRFGLVPEETVFVDDTKENLIGAERYGIHTILFESREQVLNDLAAYQYPKG